MLHARFPEYRCAFTARALDTLSKKHLFGFDYHIYRTKIIHFKPY